MLFGSDFPGDVAAVEQEANAGNVNVDDDLGENSLHIAIRKSKSNYNPSYGTPRK